MEQQPSIKKNYFYNMCYQIFLIIVPLITTPYISRVLQSDGIGRVSLVTSICAYFSIFAALGFNYYAQRTISKVSKDKESQSKIFWEICIVKLFSTIISFFVFLIFFFAFHWDLLYLVCGISILNVGIDTTFIFQGNENFKQIALRNILVKSVSIICIFLFVKDSGDTLIYALITVLSSVFSCLFMFPFLKNYLVKVKLKDLKPLKHLWPTLRLFIPTIAISVYTFLDKTMIGVLIHGNTTVISNGIEVIKSTSELENGYYEQAHKVINILLTVLTALGAVMIPRNAKYLEEKNIEGLKNNIYTSTAFVFMIGLPMMLGMIAVSRNFASWFFGPGYDKTVYLMMILSGLLFSIGLNNVFGIQYIIPTGKDWLYTLSVSCGAVVNFVLNFILIKKMNSYGAAIASVIAETVILLIQIFCLRKEFNWLKIIKSSLKYVFASAVMFITIFPISLHLSPSILHTLLLVGLGSVEYVLLLILVKDKFVYGTLKKLTTKRRNDEN